MTIEGIKRILGNFLADKPVKKAWIFGSYARGEETPESDIDILVDFDEDNYPSLMEHSGLMIEIEEILGKRIDLVPNECLYPRLRPSVDADKILIYERD